MRAVFERETSALNDPTAGVAELEALVPGLTGMVTPVATPSPLVGRLAPPEQPLLEEPTYCRMSDYSIVASVLPVGLWICFKYLPQGGPAHGTALLGWSSLIWILGVAIFALPVARIRNQTRSRYEWELKRWEERMCNWADLRYCAACDTVVNPKTAKSVSVDRIGSLLSGAVRASTGKGRQAKTHDMAG